jgi:hypothetical protein
MAPERSVKIDDQPALALQGAPNNCMISLYIDGYGNIFGCPMQGGTANSGPDSLNFQLTADEIKNGWSGFFDDPKLGGTSALSCGQRGVDWIRYCWGDNKDVKVWWVYFGNDGGRGFTTATGEIYQVLIDGKFAKIQ